jgi:hypothetical protein
MKKRWSYPETEDIEIKEALKGLKKYHTEHDTPYWAKKAIKKRGSDRCAITAAHTKNPAAWWTAWAANKGTDLLARFAIWGALDGNVKKLADRLRKRRASPGEMAFVADLIEGKVKSRRLKKGELSRYDSDEIAKLAIFDRAKYPDVPRKLITGDIADAFRLKGNKYGRSVYNKVDELDPVRRRTIEGAARNLAKKRREKIARE